MSQLTWNPLRGEYLAQASERMNRREGALECIFCADSVGRHDAWRRPNDFPALTPPAGECFLLLYTDKHDASFASLSSTERDSVMELWRETTAVLGARYPAVMIFENRGAEIGQTQVHPHGQAYGVAVIPPLLQQELTQLSANCVICDEVSDNAQRGLTVLSGEHWLAGIPAYARYPYETHVWSRRHAPSLLEADGLPELGDILQQVARAFDRLTGEPMPYMLGVHQLRDEHFHVHVELLPVRRAPGKLKFAASSEALYGLWINDSLPERKAAELRAALEAS